MNRKQGLGGGCRGNRLWQLYPCTCKLNWKLKKNSVWGQKKKVPWSILGIINFYLLHLFSLSGEWSSESERKFHFGLTELQEMRARVILKIFNNWWHPTPVLLPGKSHGRRSLVGYSPWGRWESDTTERFMHWRRKWQPTPVFLPRAFQGRGSLVGCRLWGHTESDTTEAT